MYTLIDLSGDVYGKGTLSCIKYILNLLCDIQGIFLDIYKKGNINDIPAFRYYWGNASIKFHEDVTHYDFFDFTNPDELSRQELYKNISRYVKGCIDKLESKSEIPHQHYFLVGMYLTHYRNRFIVNNEIKCIFRELLGDVENIVVDNICRGGYLKKDAPAISESSCSYTVGDDFNQKSDCIIMDCLKDIYTKRSEKKYYK